MQPLALDALPAQVRELVEPIYTSADTKNILMTLVKSPALLASWLPLSRFTFTESSLEPVDIELISLRTTWVCGADYEFTHHAKLASQRGLSDEEINGTAVGASATVFHPRQQLLLRVVDELLATRNLSDALWHELASAFTEEQCLDVVATCNNYQMISTMQNVLAVQMEEGFPLHPACEARTGT